MDAYRTFVESNQLKTTIAVAWETGLGTPEIQVELVDTGGSHHRTPVLENGLHPRRIGPIGIVTGGHEDRVRR